MAEYCCRFCNSPLRSSMVDLGSSPLSNSLLKPGDLAERESVFALHPMVCEVCFLAQLPPLQTPQTIFQEYVYFSSYSDSWLEHCRRYVAEVSERLALGAGSRVVEIASNDGYLLRYFKERGVPCLGVEPARNVAEVARSRGIETVCEFFGLSLARELLAKGWQADLVVANNVLAHVPDLNDFVAGLAALLKPDGCLTVEVPHLLRLLANNQFDTIYHEHFSYFSLMTLRKVAEAHGLTIFDLEELSTHGGSLRLYFAPVSSGRGIQAGVERVLRQEIEARLDSLEAYQGFGQRVQGIREALRGFLSEARRLDKRVVGYGAPAKATTLLNYCGIGADLLPFTVDRNPYKQGCFIPGVRVPIQPVEALRPAQPDYVLILPWNLREEVMSQLAWIREWGGQFVVPIPRLEVLG
ncbi:MAG: class I SAM-dependent methyltransferase [Magnetococcales bacterium]|nr:class I SAM-dependent methyltransferase [Magnetococcales bacterium]